MHHTGRGRHSAYAHLERAHGRDGLKDTTAVTALGLAGRALGVDVPEASAGRLHALHSQGRGGEAGEESVRL